jgi:hypothetical protein
VILADGTVVPPNPFGIPFIDPNSIGEPGGPVLLEDGGFALRADLVAFMLAFDTNFAPVVGQQVSLSKNTTNAGARIDLLKARHAAGECELIAKGSTVLGLTAGWLYDGTNFRSDLSFVPALTDEQLRGLATSGVYASLTYTCVPNGSGARMGIDRDADGYADGDELLYGTSPTNPDSHP